MKRFLPLVPPAEPPPAAPPMVPLAGGLKRAGEAVPNVEEVRLPALAALGALPVWGALLAWLLCAFSRVALRLGSLCAGGTYAVALATTGTIGIVGAAAGAVVGRMKPPKPPADGAGAGAGEGAGAAASSAAPAVLETVLPNV